MIFQEKFKESIKISWTITDRCNFKCEYCNVWKIKNSKEESSIELPEIEKVVSKIGKEWIFNISGGEPFLKKDFISICKTITKNHYISVITNLSTSNVYSFADQIDPKKVLFVSCSTHSEERKRMDPNLDDFIEKIKYLQNKNFNVIVTYVAYPDLFLKINDDYGELKKRGVKKVQMKAFRGVLGDKVYPEAYTKEDISFLRSLNLEYPEMDILNGKYSFYGQDCNAGMNSFKMDKSGNLVRCSRLKRRYGNLFEGNYKFDEKPKPCPLKLCGCPYEGIRNATSKKSSTIKTYIEACNQGYHKSLKLIEDPKLILKLKTKILEQRSFSRVIR